MPTRLLAFTFAASLVTACAGGRHPAEYLGLKSADDAALDECRAAIQAERCAGRPDAGACWDEVVAEYSALAEVAARKRYLIDAGCPSPKVEVWLPDGG